LSIPAQEPG